MDRWERYLRWNEAVASTVFPELSDPVPAYLDLEDSVLAEIARHAGYDGLPRKGLQEAVCGVTVTGSSFSLSAVWRHQRGWRAAQDYSVAPPSLAFLALTVLAAEDMGKSDDGFHPLNYYSRLCSLLGVAPESEDVRREYRHWAEPLWEDLNRWLEEHEGLRGMPTAYALTFPYVGLPLSQALVREGDRRKFPHFFAEYGLAPGMELAPEVLERYLDAWFATEACPASVALKKLWAKTSARERIATVAAVELMGWNGTIEAAQVGEAPPLKRVGLMAQLRQGFMGSSLDLALTIRHMGSDKFDGRMQVKSADGDWLQLGFMPTAANLWRTSFTGGLEMATVLAGVVELRREDAGEDILRHYPRSIVPLVFDELQSAFLEQERLQLNVDSMLLVQERAKGKPLAASVEDILRAYARPGFAVERERDGLPDGWVLFAGVQLFAAPGTDTYNELVPLARDQLTIAGGMRIPSRVRKWSTRAAPEIRASVESASKLRLVLAGAESDGPPRYWASDGGALIVPLAQAELEVGDYRVALYAGDSKKPLQQATVRLRSADVLDAGWHLAPRLTYSLSEPGGPLGAISAREFAPEHPALTFVDGTLVEGSNGLDVTVSATAEPLWANPKQEAPVSASVRIGPADPKSCVVTGAHHFMYPTWHGGRTSKYIEGVCRYCGLVKRDPAWPSKKKSKHGQESTPQVNVADLPHVAVTTGALWDAALDALMHLGGGSAAALTAVASQIEGGALFASAFPARLEALGHIAVERLPSGEPTRWEVSPTCLVAIPDGLELVGFWPDNLVKEALDVLKPLGGRLVQTAAASGPSRRCFAGTERLPDDSGLEDLAEISHDATTAMLSVLPRLSQVASQLPREPLPGFGHAERYDISSSSWVQTNHLGAPGAYRLTRDFERVHLFRSQSDVEQGLAARASVYLVKHLAANALGKSLVMYLSKSQYVLVPRGCDLPGLYGRAMVLASGELPHPGKVPVGRSRRNCLSYPNISQAQADFLVTLLSS